MRASLFCPLLRRYRITGRKKAPAVYEFYDETRNGGTFKNNCRQDGND